MRRTPATTVYLLIFLVLGGIYYYLNNRPEPAEEISLTFEPQEAPSYLFSAEDGIPTSIRIEAKDGGNVEVARNAENAWALIQPDEVAAEQGSSEAAASQVTTMRILSTLSDLDPNVVGLNPAEYVLTVKFSSGVERTVKIGVLTPVGDGYYVENAKGEVVIVSRSSVDALLNLLTFPPYLETPTPTALPTETFTPLPPTPEVGTLTPEATATP